MKAKTLRLCPGSVCQGH